jgi:hypothetical protein
MTLSFNKEIVKSCFDPGLVLGEVDERFVLIVKALFRTTIDVGTLAFLSQLPPYFISIHFTYICKI